MSATLGQLVDRLEREGLLAGDVGAIRSATDVPVAGVTTDSRRVRPGVVFCAIRGVDGDGHRYLTDAASGGAPAVFVEEAVPDLMVPQVTVSSGRRAAAFAAAEFHGDPWKAQTLIGVTGTNGKTTTVSILRHVMGKDRPAASIGTLGVVGPDGIPVAGTTGLTTPGPSEIADLLRALLEQGVKAVAMEVSSHALEQDRVAALAFSAGIFTNFTRDHLDYHGTFEAYRDAKLKLADLVRPGGVVVSNIDDPVWEGIRPEGAHLVRFGTQGRGEVQAEDIRFERGGTRWTLWTPSCTAEVVLPLSGMYNVYNAVAASAALWGLGWTADWIAECLTDLPQIPGRLERLPSATGARIFIDYAHTPNALERALLAVRPLTDGRVIVVFGAGGDRDRGKRPEMGRVAAKMADLSIVTSDNPRHEDPLAIIAEIEAGMGDAPRESIADRREAIARALEVARREDLVLLAGKGHETYQIWGDEYRPFDEREVVREIFETKGIAE